MKIGKLNMKIVFLLTFIGSVAGCINDSVYTHDENNNHTIVKNIQPILVSTIPVAIYETSGLAFLAPNRFLSHNDKGNTNQLYIIDTTGRVQRTITISNVQNNDWEDLAMDTNSNIYINDAGNNDNNRTNLAIYRIPNPLTFQTSTITAEIISFVFEDQTQFPPPASQRNFDIEAMIWKSDTLFLFTKDRSNPFTGYTKQYAVPAHPANHIARLIDSFFVDSDKTRGRITAADINHQTGEVVLLTHTRILSFTEYIDNKFFRGKITDYRFTMPIGQAEAFAFMSDHHLYITNENTGEMEGRLWKVILTDGN